MQSGKTQDELQWIVERKLSLSTYNTWTQFELFAQELPLPTSQAPLAIKPFAAEEAHTPYGRRQPLAE